jgi:hypothetical protein
MHEVSRVIPVSSGEWSWWPLVIIFGAIVFCILVDEAKKVLNDCPRWHSVLVVIATLLSAALLTGRIDVRDADWFVFLVMFLVMLVPSIAAASLIVIFAWHPRRRPVTSK